MQIQKPLNSIKQSFKKHFWVLVMTGCLATSGAYSQDVIITVNAADGKRAISPNIYGRNNTFDQPVSFYKDAGLRFVRMNNGNNATKYNWRKKITSHPDWYNNVYGSDWDETSEYIADNFPGMQVMWAFQLLGRVASNTSHNFNDWGFNQSQWWQGVHQNLAGGGMPNTVDPGGDALVEGDYYLYTVEWPADSTVAILDHWFGPDGLNLDKNQFLYWNMDNEPDIWNGTHDDVMDELLPASEFMDRFIEVAKKARAKFPEIKICGPVTTSEWQWYKWGDESIRINGKYYCWFEYFIKRCADEEKASGIRVLDVFDIHHYPYAPTDNDALQNHRIFYDMDYIYPGANGVKTIYGGWDNSLTKEYVFKRIEDWLHQYYGEDHGITLGISEWSPGPNDPNLASVIYATHLGTFANNEVEYFTPWNWFTGMWESLHLFSWYAKSYSVVSTSSLENTVSAYASLNDAADSMTVIIVNRDMNSERNVTVNLNNCVINDGNYTTLQLSSLPSTETFKSHTDNALTENTVQVNSNAFTITVPALSTTAVLFSSITVGIEEHINLADEIKLFPNPVAENLTVDMNPDHAGNLEITIIDQSGRRIHSSQAYYDGNSPVMIDISTLSEGFYLLTVKNNKVKSVKSFCIIR
ncbi:MAG: T9SS type A sorting domain-containing protein [Bacteroidales bacterium]|nr:T9SS type A sorting domain-containing protein [Bacteroidales bacterium]